MNRLTVGHTMYVETIPIGEKQFQLTRSLFNGLSGCGDDLVETYQIEDRFEAAIINVGMACRYLYDHFPESKFNAVIIITDTDGKDIKYNGEHNALYGLLHPDNNYEARKYASLYQHYNKYLLRIRELQRAARIKIFLGEKIEYEIF